MQDIASYFNLPSPLPSLTPLVLGLATLSVLTIPQGPGRINPLVAAAFVNPARRRAAARREAAKAWGQRQPVQSGTGMDKHPGAGENESKKRLLRTRSPKSGESFSKAQL